MKRTIAILMLGLTVTIAATVLAGSTWAAQPEPWRLGMQPGVTPVAHEIRDLYNLVFWIVAAVCVFVLALMIYIVWRFNARRNPTPSKTTHNTLLEIIWTVVPVIIVAAIAVPSIKLLYFMDRTTDADMTLKVTGYQWYWSYEYPDQNGIAFDAIMVPEDKLAEGQTRLLETDNRVVIPVDTNIRILVTSQDVIHSWAVPAFGVKIDSVPGRTNETWIRVEKEGVYYGQCSELCGVNHAFMPVAVEVVAKDKFEAWVQEARKKFASANGSSLAMMPRTETPN